LYAAAPLKPKSIAYFISYEFPLHNVFGMSENTGPVAQSYFEYDVWYAGAAMPGCAYKIF